MGEDLGQVVDPEHLTGSGVVAELQLEIGERALRLRPGDVAAEGTASDLSTPPRVKGVAETDGSEAERAWADGNQSDVVTVRCRCGRTGLVGIV